MPPGTAFGAVLRRFRGAAQLTQAGLAERSGVGVETIRSLESGRRKSPRDETLHALIAALGLAGAELAEFMAATTGVTPHAAVPHELPADVQDFTGRADEVRRLVALLAVPGSIAVTGPPGIGKTALAVHAARQVTFPAGETFRTKPAAAVVGGLVLLDDFTQATVPATAGGTVVVTSRRSYPELEGERRIELTGLPPSDAVLLLHRLTGAERWLGDPEGTLDVVRLCAGNPAALRRAAARMIGRPAWAPAELYGWLRTRRTVDTS